MKRIRLIFVLCLLASAEIVQARHVSGKAYKGGNFTLEFGAFTSAGSKISFTGFTLTPVGGYTFSEHLFLGGGVSFCFNTVDNFFSMSMPVFVRGKYALLKSRITNMPLEPDKDLRNRNAIINLLLKEIATGKTRRYTP